MKNQIYKVEELKKQIKLLLKKGILDSITNYEQNIVTYSQIQEISLRAEHVLGDELIKILDLIAIELAPNLKSYHLNQNDGKDFVECMEKIKSSILKLDDKRNLEYFWLTYVYILNKCNIENSFYFCK